VLEIVFGGLAATAMAGALWLLAVRQRERARVWLAAAAAAGLSEVAIRKSILGSLSLVGRSGTLRVRVRATHRRDHRGEAAAGEEGAGALLEGAGARLEAAARIELDDPIHPMGGVGLRPEDAATEFGKAFGKREIEIGDPSFDEDFFISGAPALVHAFLDTDTRARIFRLNHEGRFEITGPVLRLDIPESDEGRLLANAVELSVGLARRLANRADTAERLASNARNDLWPAVRLRNLLCLIRRFGEDPRVGETLRAACADRDPEVRLRAATALGPEGVPTLVGMTEDVGLADVWQAAAVAALGRNLTLERAKATLEFALRGKRLETARACAEALGSCGPGAVEPLVEALAVHVGLVAAAAARSLGALGAPAAEAPLIRALHGVAPGLLVAAAEALGRTGTVAAVLPLKSAAERSRDPHLRRAARQAVAEIQARLPGASPGQLSLSATEAGQLSLADAEAGDLSFPPGEPGRLSLAERDGGRRAGRGQAGRRPATGG
jgi:HEAT repeat protein